MTPTQSAAALDALTALWCMVGDLVEGGVVAAGETGMLDLNTRWG